MSGFKEFKCEKKTQASLEVNFYDVIEFSAQTISLQGWAWQDQRTGAQRVLLIFVVTTLLIIDPKAIQVCGSEPNSPNKSW